MRCPSIRIDADSLPTLSALHGEFHFTVGKGKQCVIAPGPYVCARMKPCAPLPDDDRPGSDLLTTEDLHTQHLRLRVAAVSSRSAALFLCHFLLLPASLRR